MPVCNQFLCINISKSYEWTLTKLRGEMAQVGRATGRNRLDIGEDPISFVDPASFLQGVSIPYYASPVLATIGMSACHPSVTHWHRVKKTQATITKSSPTDSPRTLVFEIKSYPEIRKGSS